MGDQSYFEPDVRLETNTGDNFFYALVYERFWDTMLPALERVRNSLAFAEIRL